MHKKRKHKIILSFIMITFNGEKSLRRALESVRMQKFPSSQYEIVVVDNGSTDNTVRVAKSFGARIILNTHDSLYRSLAMAYHAARGVFIYQFDLDEELCDENFIRKMLHPLVTNTRITATFTRNYPNNTMSPISRYLSYQPAQLDPIYEYFTPSIESTILEKHPGYIECLFTMKRMPGCGHLVYRRSALQSSPIWNQKYFSDQEVLTGVVAGGGERFAYVPDAGYFHYHALTLKHLLAKRVRNLAGHYLKVQTPYTWKWFDTSSVSGLIKIGCWVVYANLFFPALLRGIVRSFRHRDLVMLYEPIITIATTDVILYHFLTLPEGRAFIRKSFTWMFPSI